MAQANYTPISLYYSTTASAAPTAGNLANGELAINITDGKLYYKDNSGVVQLIASKAGASGSVTTLSVVSTNGFAGTVANATTTPAITLTTTITGLLKGNGTAISAASSGTDYAPATSGTSILYGNGSGGFSNVTVGSGLTFSGGTLANTGGSGTVTSIDVSGGTTGLTTSGGPVTTSGTITLAGTLAVANGGTGQTTYTNGQLLIGNTTGNTLTKATLTGTSDQITITNGSGSITLSTPQSIGTASNVQFGSFGVGTAASGTTGEIRATNNVTAYYSSDRTLKENIRDIPDALNKACAIGGKLFDWTDDYLAQHGGADGYFVQKSDFGVIAQDVESQLPVAVRKREDGTLAVDYEKMCALAFAAIAELRAEVEALKKGN
jgi:hypothetical protein